MSKNKTLEVPHPSCVEFPVAMHKNNCSKCPFHIMGCLVSIFLRHISLKVFNTFLRYITFIYVYVYRYKCSFKGIADITSVPENIDLG